MDQTQSGASGTVADWHYIGYYGQLGPLTKQQIDELIVDGVIDRTTYVWKTGMSDWRHAADVPELAQVLARYAPLMEPPAPPGTAVSPPSLSVRTQTFQSSSWDARLSMAPPSDRSRYVAGVLQLLIPGAGRLYLGYLAYGVLQLLLAPCAFVGFIWSWIDGLIILVGGVTMDGYGRKLNS